VFAVPGNINSKTSRGTNKLIKDGAKLVACTDDILEELTSQLNFPATTRNVSKKTTSKVSIRQDRTSTLNPDEKSVWNNLSDDPKHIDKIIGENQLKGSSIYAILLNLELKSFIQEHPGKYYSRAN
jgi:DNA processing protein